MTNNCKKLSESVKTVRLDNAVQQLLDGRFSPRQARFDLVAETWSRLLPAGLSRHCDIIDISRDRLRVQVDSPSYLYELQLCSTELLKELQRMPAARIKKIKFSLA